MFVMKQREHIETLIQISERRREEASRIQTVYLKCAGDFRDGDFTELIGLLDAYYGPVVKKQLYMADCYSEDNEHAAMQEARLGVWEFVMNGDPGRVESFLGYTYRIYYNKAHDVIRKEFSRRKNFQVCSISEPIREDGKTIEDTLPPVWSDDGTGSERARLLNRLFRMYCRAFLSSGAFPPQNLALYYARVLPHLLCVIPDTKAASAKWAADRMKGRSVGELREDSERTLQRSVDQQMAWGDAFVRQLDGPAGLAGSAVLLRDVIYTETYDKGKIEDWADYRHRATVKEAAVLISGDKELLGLAKEYISKRDVLYGFVK